MTQPSPPEQTPPSIYTRLDGTPLPPRQAPCARVARRRRPRSPVRRCRRQRRPAGSSSCWPPGLAPVRLRGRRRDLRLLAWLVMLPVGVALGLTVNESAGYFSQTARSRRASRIRRRSTCALAVQAMLPGIALAIALVRMEGQTPGKRWAGIRVVRADGQPVDAQTAFPSRAAREVDPARDGGAAHPLHRVVPELTVAAVGSRAPCRTRCARRHPRSAGAQAVVPRGGRAAPRVSRRRSRRR